MDVIMPQLGETVAEGKVAGWFKAVGDSVAAGETLFEIETDKVSMEVQATMSGTLAEIRVAAGETVPVGTVVAVVAGIGEAAAPKPAAAPAKMAGNGKAALAPFDEVHTPKSDFGPAEGPLGLKVTPLARRLVKQGGLDLKAIAEAVRARGGRRIGAEDVKAAQTRAPRPASLIEARAPLVPGPRDAIEPLTRIRQQTAVHLAEAWRTAPHVFQAVEVDFSLIERARQKAKAGFADRHGVALTYLPFIARAAVVALAEFPRINASFDRDRLILHRDIHLGIAVDLDHQGLIVPVVHDADGMNVAGLAKAIHRLAEKARGAKLLPADVEGGTYTISNNGSFGTLFTAPIINVPQVAVLSTDAVRKRPIVVESAEGDAMAIRPVGVVGQSFDHRAMDGAYSASFLKRLKAIAETRDWDAELT